jgi:hypothetical protein
VPGFTPGPNLEPGAKAGYLPSRFNTRFTWSAVHAPSPRAVGISLALSPASSACSRPCRRALLAGHSGLYAHLHGWLDATVTAQLRTAHLGGGERHLRPGADPEPLVFYHHDHHVDDEPVGVRHVGGNEVAPNVGTAPVLECGRVKQRRYSIANRGGLLCRPTGLRNRRCA